MDSFNNQAPENCGGVNCFEAAYVWPVTQNISTNLMRRVDLVSEIPNKYQLADDLAALPDTAPGQRRVLVYIDIPGTATAFDIGSVHGVAPYENLIRGIAQNISDTFAGSANVYYLTDTRFALLSRDSDSAAFMMRFILSQEGVLHDFAAVPNLPAGLSGFGGIFEFEINRESVLDAPLKALSAANQAFFKQQKWAIYDAEAALGLERSCRLLNDVEQAVANNQLHLVYQPKMDLESGAYLSGEALVRWNHPELGPISPVEFVPLVEKTAQIRAFTDWVIGAALDQLREWHAGGLKIKLAINLSARNFDEPDIPLRLGAACRARGIAPEYLEIECTEGLWMEGSGAFQNLRDIRGLGMAIALDDFGTGYSNFSYLQKVPATIIKLDQSLIRNINSNSHDQQIVQSMIFLGKELGYRIVAEGVETEEILALVKGWGCDEVQGYFLARPLMPAAFKAHLQKNRQVQKHTLTAMFKRAVARAVRPIAPLLAFLNRRPPCTE